MEEEETENLVKLIASVIVILAIVAIIIIALGTVEIPRAAGTPR